MRLSNWTHSSPIRSIVALAAAALVLAGCAINIDTPANNDKIVGNPSTNLGAVVVTVSGNANYSGLQVVIDRFDMTHLMRPIGPRTYQATIDQVGGRHTVRASAEMDCFFCNGGTFHSTDSRSFLVVSSPESCTRSGGPPVITLESSVIEIGQRPGRSLIAWALRNSHDGLLIVIDDAPGLSPTEMLVEIDIDPFNGVDWAKGAEAWGLCHTLNAGTIQASKLGGFNEGTACAQLGPSNDYRSGCTRTESMHLFQDSARELWLRKPGWFGSWGDVEAVDESMWRAFGGRSVRFIWRFN